MAIASLAAAIAAAAPSSAAQCGGSRKHLCTWSIGTGPHVSGNLYGSFYAEVDGLDDAGNPTGDPQTASAVWLSGMAFGAIPGLGNVIIHYEPSPPSTVALTSNDPDPEVFFPATAVQTLHYRLDVLDSQGSVVQSLVLNEPAVLQATIDSIPPFGSSFSVASDLDFVDPSAPTVPVITLVASESSGVLEDPGGLSVSPSFAHANGTSETFSSTWNIQNLTGSPLSIHWFATGIHGAVVTTPSLGWNVPLDSVLEVSVQGTFDSTDPSAGVVVHAVSANSPDAEDHAVLLLADAQSPGVPTASGLMIVLFVSALGLAGVLSLRRGRRQLV